MRAHYREELILFLRQKVSLIWPQHTRIVVVTISIITIGVVIVTTTITVVAVTSYFVTTTFLVCGGCITKIFCRDNKVILFVYFTFKKVFDWKAWYFFM